MGPERNEMEFPAIGVSGAHIWTRFGPKSVPELNLVCFYACPSETAELPLALARERRYLGTGAALGKDELKRRRRRQINY